MVMRPAWLPEIGRNDDDLTNTWYGILSAILFGISNGITSVAIGTYEKAFDPLVITAVYFMHGTLLYGLVACIATQQFEAVMDEATSIYRAFPVGALLLIRSDPRCASVAYAHSGLSSPTSLVWRLEVGDSKRLATRLVICVIYFTSRSSSLSFGMCSSLEILSTVGVSSDVSSFSLRLR